MRYIGQIFICRGGVLTTEKTTPMIPHFYGLILKWMSTFTYQMVFIGLLHMSERAAENQEPQVMSLESALIGAKNKKKGTVLVLV